MAWAHEVNLGNWVETIFHGEPTRAVEWSKVYADKKSVRQSEFYAGRNAGLKPEMTLVVRSIEFDNHEKAQVDGKVYDITRVYDKGEYTELTLTAPTGGEV